MKRYLEISDPVIDSHMHIFNYEHIPNGFLGPRLPFRMWFLRGLENICGGIGKVAHIFGKDTATNYHNFVDMFDDSSSLDIFAHALSYERDSIHCALTMDMTCSVKGKMQLSFGQQMAEMCSVRDKFPHRLLPFVAIDPNNPDAMKHFEQAFTTGWNFFGVKIYPSLGYLPSHPVLMDIFAICEKNQIPVIAHCSSASVKANYKELRLLGYEVDANGNYKEINRLVKYRSKEDWAELNNPINLFPVLNKYKNLKLDLAHLGAYRWPSWLDTIRQYMKWYPNFVSDVSYTFADPDKAAVIKRLLQFDETFARKCIYGTDFYMPLIEGNFGDMRQRFIDSLGAELFDKIARRNPRRWLFNQ